MRTIIATLKTIIATLIAAAILILVVVPAIYVGALSMAEWYPYYLDRAVCLFGHERACRMTLPPRFGP